MEQKLKNTLCNIIDKNDSLNNTILYEILVIIDKVIEILISDELYILYLDEKNKIYDNGDIHEMFNIIELMIHELK